MVIEDSLIKGLFIKIRGGLMKILKSNKGYDSKEVWGILLLFLGLKG